MCGRRTGRPERAGLVLALLAMGCATNPAPGGWLPEAAQAQREAWGGWAWIRCKEVREPCAQGELIAVGESAVHVLTPKALVAIEAARIKSATVAGYRTQENAIASLGFAGTISTLSHGIYLLVSAPVWVLASASAAGSESRSAFVSYPKRPLADLKLFARYPQGLPPDLPALAPKESPR